MSALDMSPELAALIKQIQNDLLPLVPKPTLMTKFLARPPFRFLRDVVISLLRTTGEAFIAILICLMLAGFGKGLFDDGEIETSVRRSSSRKLMME